MIERAITRTHGAAKKPTWSARSGRRQGEGEEGGSPRPEGLSNASANVVPSAAHESLAKPVQSRGKDSDIPQLSVRVTARNGHSQNTTAMGITIISSDHRRSEEQGGVVVLD